MTITAHTIENGPRNLIVQFNIDADAGDDYSDYELLDLNDYIGEDSPTPNEFSVKRVSGQNNEGSMFSLKFGSSTNDHSLFFSTTDEGFEKEWVGGLPNLVIDKDMTIRLSSDSVSSAGLLLSLEIWLKKKLRSETA